MLFFLILGSSVPNFNTFLYYYETEVLGITQIVISWLSVVSYAALFLGVSLYSMCLLSVQIRWMMVIACCINLFGAVTTLLFTRGMFLGMPPLVFLIMTTTVTDTLYNAFTQMPAMVLFAKLIPESVESSMFALLTGLMNFSLYAAQELAIFVNSFIGVNSDSLNRLWELYAIQAGCCCIPLLFVCILPSKAQVSVV